LIQTIVPIHFQIVQFQTLFHYFDIFLGRLRVKFIVHIVDLDTIVFEVYEELLIDIFRVPYNMSHTTFIDDCVLFEVEIYSAQYFVGLVVIDYDQPTFEPDYQLNIINALHYFIFEPERLYIFVHVAFFLLQVNIGNNFELAMSIFNKRNIRKSPNSYDPGIPILCICDRNMRVEVEQMSRCTDFKHMAKLGINFMLSFYLVPR